MSQDAFQVAFDHLGQLHHRAEDPAHMPGYPPHPPAPDPETPASLFGGGAVIDVTQDQTHLVGLGRDQRVVHDFGQARLLVGPQVFRIFAPQPLAAPQLLPGFLEV